MSNFLKYCFPSKIVSTVFWIGFLPEWTRHWSAALSILVSILIIILTCGLSAGLPDLSYILILQTIYTFILALISNPIFKKIYKGVEEEKIVIDAFIAQTLFLGLCTPAIRYVNIGVLHFNKSLCDRFMICTDFFYQTVSLCITLLMPYGILRFFDIMEFWPTSQILLRSSNYLARLFAGLVPALYSIIFLYSASFIFFSLTVVSVIEFYSFVFIKYTCIS